MIPRPRLSVPAKPADHILIGVKASPPWPLRTVLKSRPTPDLLAPASRLVLVAPIVQAIPPLPIWQLSDRSGRVCFARRFHSQYFTRKERQRWMVIDCAHKRRGS